MGAINFLLNKGRKIIVFFLIIASASFINLEGFSSWVIKGKAVANEDVALADKTSSASYCCYIDTNASGNQYYTIEKALDVATSGQTVYVIPGINPKITKNCTIKSGVTLSLPYQDGVNYDAGIGDGGLYSTSTTTYDEAFLKESTYLKSKVTIDSNVTLTNNGTLNIGGIVSGNGGGQKLSSMTATDYAQLTLSDTAKIDSYGTINCFGYIDGNQASTSLDKGLHCYSGSTTKVVFTVREHRGGSIFSGMNDDLKTSPFNRFYVSTIKNVNYCFDYNSTLNGFADLYANSNHNTTTINLIGTSSSNMIQLMSGSSFKGRFSSSNHVNNAGIYGSSTLNPLSLSVAGATINTSTVYFPVSWYWNLSLNVAPNTTTATFSSTTQDIKLLPGATVAVGQGVTWNAKNIAVYNAFTDIGTGASTYQSDGTKNPAALTVNGSINATGLAGNVAAGSSGATISYSQDTLTTYELSGTNGSNLSTSVFYSDYKWGANGKYNSNNSLCMLGSGGCPFTSNGTYWTSAGTVSAERIFVINASTGGANAGTTGAAQTHYLKTYFTSTDGDSISACTWQTSDTTNGPLSAQSASGATLSLTKNATTTSASVTVTATITTVNGQTYTTTGTYTRTPKASGGCLILGTPILMADGTYKNIESVKSGEHLKTWSFENGRYEDQIVILNEAVTNSNVPIIHLKFISGKEIDVVWQQGFFDVDFKKYFVVNEDNAYSMVGRRVFSYGANNSIAIDTISEVSISKETISYYEIETTYNFNIIANDILSVGPVIVNANFFDVDNNYKWDSAKMQEDIATYGLYTYEEFKKILDIPEWLFDFYQGKYFKVAIGKGEFTIEEVIDAIGTYASNLGL